MKQRIRQFLAPQIEAQLREHTASLRPVRAELQAVGDRVEELGVRIPVRRIAGNLPEGYLDGFLIFPWESCLWGEIARGD